MPVSRRFLRRKIRQGMRRISALYTPYNYEIGVDLREQMTLCDVGDVFTIPANIEKTFDQISNARRTRVRSGALPTIISMHDVERLGLDKVTEIALEYAWRDADAVWLSFGIDSRGLRLRARHRLARAGRLLAA